MFAKDLKKGMVVKGWGEVEEIHVHTDCVDVTFSCHDHDCGETEYFPCVVPHNDLFELETE